MAEQTSQPRSALNAVRFNLAGIGRWLIANARRTIAQTLMWTKFVVIVSVGLDEMIQLPQAETEQDVQALSLEVADPRLGETIGDGRPVGRKHRPAVVAPEMLVERLGKLRVPVVDQKSHIDMPSSSAHMLALRACWRIHSPVGL